MARPDCLHPLLEQLENRLRRLTGHPSTELIELAESCGISTDIRTMNEELRELNRQIRDAMRIDL